MNKSAMLATCCFLAIISASANAAFFAGFSEYDVDGDGSLGSGPSTGPLLTQFGATLFDDCNDANASVSPYALEVVDFVDNNCDAISDNVGAPQISLPNAVIADDPVTVVSGNALTLDGSGSWSPNGNITAFHWFLDDSGQATLSTSDAVSVISWVTLESLGYVSGSYNIGLVVQDEIGAMTYVGTPSPVPIPAAAWLFGSAIVGAGIVGRRKKKAA